MIHPLILLGIFVVSTLAGYFIIRRVPSLLHTPLMSGMNALSGVTIVGALTATGIAALLGEGKVAMLIGSIGVGLAAINVVGGFAITHRMLRMFKQKKQKQ